MKVGILTHPFEKNYGGILQNWALQQVLKNLGYEPVTINWRSNVPDWGTFLSVKTLKCVISYFYHFIKPPKVNFPRSPLWKDANAKGIHNFIKKNIVTTRPIFKKEVTKFAQSQFDILVVGSDQVWRPVYISPIEMMFFPFKKREGQKKIAFSASFGINEWEFTEEQTELCRDLAQDFDAISVREYSGIELCSNYFNVSNVEWTLDPTLMIDKIDYEGLCENISRSTEDYTFAYILDENENTESACNSVKHNLNEPLKKLGVDNRVTPRDSIENWLASFRDSKYVITDSFHGVVFCLIFHKPFALFYNPYRGNARFDSLIKFFPQINERIIVNGKLPEQRIDWEMVDANIHKYRKSTISYLQNALS